MKSMPLSLTGAQVDALYARVESFWDKPDRDLDEYTCLLFGQQHYANTDFRSTMGAKSGGLHGLLLCGQFDGGVG